MLCHLYGNINTANEADICHNQVKVSRPMAKIQDYSLYLWNGRINSSAFLSCCLKIEKNEQSNTLVHRKTKLWPCPSAAYCTQIQWKGLGWLAAAAHGAACETQGWIHAQPHREAPLRVNLSSWGGGDIPVFLRGAGGYWQRIKKKVCLVQKGINPAFCFSWAASEVGIPVELKPNFKATFFSWQKPCDPDAPSTPILPQGSLQNLT